MTVEDDPSEDFPQRVGGQSQNLMNSSEGEPLGGSDPSPRVLKQRGRKIQRRERAREESGMENSGMKNTKKFQMKIKNMGNGGGRRLEEMRKPAMLPR